MDFLGWLFRPITQPINKSREEFVHQANRYYDLLQRLTTVAVVIGYSVVFALVCFGLAAISSVIVGVSTQRTLNGLIERLGSNANNLTRIPEILLNGHDSQDGGQQALSCSVDMQTNRLLSGRGQRSYIGYWLAIACLAIMLVTLSVAFKSRKPATAQPKRVHNVASPIVQQNPSPVPARESAPTPTRPRPTRPVKPWSPKKKEASAGRKAAAVSASIGAGIGGGIGGGIAGGAGGLLATGIGCAFFPPLAIAALPMLVVGVLGGGAAAGTASALSAGKAVERGFEMKDREMVNRVRSRF